MIGLEIEWMLRLSEAQELDIFIIWLDVVNWRWGKGRAGSHRHFMRLSRGSETHRSGRLRYGFVNECPSLSGQ